MRATPRARVERARKPVAIILRRRSEHVGRQPFNGPRSSPMRSPRSPGPTSNTFRSCQHEPLRTDRSSSSVIRIDAPLAQRVARMHPGHDSSYTSIVTGCSTKRLNAASSSAPKRAVHHAVIAGERHAHHADERDAAVLCLDRLPARGADRQNGRLRRIDDGGKFAHPVHAEIGDRGRAALIFLRRELPGARARRPSPSSRSRSPTSVFVSARRITGVISPPSIATATPISQCSKRRMRSSAHTAFAAGTRAAPPPRP